MDAHYEKKYHAIEDDYWWFQGRRDCVIRLITRRLQLPKDAAILEVGCSGGPLLKHLESLGYQDLHGLDVSADAIACCRDRGLTNVAVMDATNPEFPDNSFDLVIASDILEHLERDAEALGNWRRILKPGGTLMVFVPAFQFLWSGHDVVNRHFRRYTRGKLCADLRAAGLGIRFSSYWNAILFPPVATMRVMKRVMGMEKVPKDGLSPVRPGVNKGLTALLGMENGAMLMGVRWPVGVSVMAVGEKTR